MMQEVDIVADQLIIGWYAMTAIEAMCQGIPVPGYIKPSLQELYEEAGLLEIDELPLVNCDFKMLKKN